METYITLSFNENIYRLRTKIPVVPLLLPQLTYKIDIEVENIEPTGAADMIRVFVFNRESTVPLITANISMPIAEVDQQNF